MTGVADGFRDASPSRSPESYHAPHGIQRAVLVIDDEENIRQLLRAVLSPRYHVVCAQNTQEADAVLQQRPIHVVVCDHSMPGEDGLTFLIRIRQTHPLVTRILLTGHVNSEIMLEAINRAGVLQYLVKPFCMDKLLKAVDDALRVHDSTVRHTRLGKENADLRSSLHKLLSRSASLSESPAKLLAVSSFGLLAILGVGLLLGLLVFVILYALKSALGIDFLPDWSHSGQ